MTSSPAATGPKPGTRTAFTRSCLEESSEQDGSAGLGLVHVPQMPEPYTGDPEGQALWDKTVEEDQAVMQPEDFEPESTPPPLDLRGIPAYAAQNIDADGNLN